MIQIVYDKIVDFWGVTEIPCVIVGSKIDLQQRCVWLEQCGEPCCHCYLLRLVPHRLVNRQVEPNEGYKLAEANKAAWVEISAKNDINVGEYGVDLPIHVL